MATNTETTAQTVLSFLLCFPYIMVPMLTYFHERTPTEAKNEAQVILYSGTYLARFHYLPLLARNLCGARKEV